MQQRVCSQQVTTGGNQSLILLQSLASLVDRASVIPPKSWEIWGICTPTPARLHPGVNSQQFLLARLGESRSQWLDKAIRQSAWGALKK